MDGFDQVTPGTELTFTVTAFNDIIAQTTAPQFFRARIDVSAGQCAGTKLDGHEMLILVPVWVQR